MPYWLEHSKLANDVFFGSLWVVSLWFASNYRIKSNVGICYVRGPVGNRTSTFASVKWNGYIGDVGKTMRDANERYEAMRWWNNGCDICCLLLFRTHRKFIHFQLGWEWTELWCVARDGIVTHSIFYFIIIFFCIFHFSFDFVLFVISIWIKIQFLAPRRSCEFMTKQENPGGCRAAIHVIVNCEIYCMERAQLRVTEPHTYTRTKCVDTGEWRWHGPEDRFAYSKE